MRSECPRAALVCCLLLAGATVAVRARADETPTPPPATAVRLPRVLIIGDSISKGYTPGVVRLLEGRADVSRIPDNGMWTGTGIQKLDSWLGTEKWDVIHFNWGLWDMYGWEFQAEDRSPEAYERRLEELVGRLEKTGAKLIWATTTPVCPEPEKSMRTRWNTDVVIPPDVERRYLDAADQVMKRHGVRVNDLHAVVRPDRDALQLAPDDVHFTPAGSEKLARQVAAAIAAEVEFGGLVADGGRLERLVDDCRFTEGPTAAADGTVYFTDQPNDRILRVGLDGGVSEFLAPAGRSNGLCFAPDGGLIACADEHNELWDIAPDGSHRVLTGGAGGVPWNGPNDVWVHPDGWIYFTDPYYQRPWWKHRQPPRPNSNVYRCRRDGSGAELAAGDFKQPNGIVGNPRTGELFVADIAGGKTYRFVVAPDGSLTERRLFCGEGSDGMTLDREGNVYLTGGRGVSIFDPSGKLLQRIAVPQRWTANVCFGGADRRSLYITAGDSLYRLPMKVAGW